MIQIAGALGGPWDQLGAAIERTGKEDASGFRRFLAARLHQRDYDTVCRELNIPPEEAEALRAAFVDAFGEE